jgi:outer membrane protein assembly factor BamB
MPGRASSITVAQGAVWVGVIVGNGAPDLLVRIDPATGAIVTTVPYHYGVQALAASGSALWVLARRRALVYRADLQTGAPVKRVRVGNSHGWDIAYHAGALWVATPGDNTVYKVLTGSGTQIPIGVGSHPRQLAIANGRVYVTDYNSSDLYEIDEQRGVVLATLGGLPANPYAVAAGGGAIWVTSQPESVLNRIVTGRGG